MDLEDFMATVQLRATGARVVYRGEFPKQSREYYSLTPRINHCTGFIYVLYDCAGRVLYIGRSWRPGNRFDKHRRQRWWWGDVTGLALIRFDGTDRREAEGIISAVEVLAIQKMRPVHNVTHNTLAVV